MKSYTRIYRISKLLALVFCLALVQMLQAQDVEKHKVRLNGQYVKVMDGEVMINLKASSRIGRQNVAITGAHIMISNEVGEEEYALGHVMTDENGQGSLVLPSLASLKMDSTTTYTIRALYKGNDTLTKASTRISVRDAKIIARVIEKDSVNYITAQLMDAATDSLLADRSLFTQVDRLIRPLKFGKDFNNTDEEGSIMVKIPDDIPGIDGNLLLEVVLSESDEYGTVKARVNAPVGVPVVQESTFDQRTMWGPKNKAPMYLLIIANFIIFGIWITIVYLIRNLFRISKA
ncbi:hypothetical protein [Namhaeicola litoreus]|uniref:DUF4198 domain-containing protein n=1 Tax=Namhaeicola litoreus TaxID=1052145 RepID=A0ABW3XYS6_9FLAO